MHSGAAGLCARGRGGLCWPGGHRELLEPRGAFSPKGFDAPVQAFGLANEAQ